MHNKLASKFKAVELGDQLHHDTSKIVERQGWKRERLPTPDEVRCVITVMLTISVLMLLSMLTLMCTECSVCNVGG